MPEYTLVERADTITADLSGSDYIGVDTEFMREKTFFAELCLVQISTDDSIYCVDPLIAPDMKLFWDTVMDSGWVAHSARQDIEVIYQAAERMPARLFDTQIAAGLLGFAPQMGYANLVSELARSRTCRMSRRLNVALISHTPATPPTNRGSSPMAAPTPLPTSTTPAIR